MVGELFRVAQRGKWGDLIARFVLKNVEMINWEEINIREFIVLVPDEFYAPILIEVLPMSQKRKGNFSLV